MDPNTAPAKILLIESDAAERARLCSVLCCAGFAPHAYASTEEAVDNVPSLLPDLILLGACAGGPGDRRLHSRQALLEMLRPWLIPMIVFRDGRQDKLLALLEAGAADCLSRRASAAELRARLQAHLHFSRLALQVEDLTHRLDLAHSEKNSLLRTLHESEERFDRIAENATDAIIMIDCEGRVVLWNAAAERIFGYAKDEMLGRDLHAILSLTDNRPQPSDFNHLYITQVAQGPGPIVEFLARRKDGEMITVEVSRSPAAIAGQPVMLGIARDITERKRLLRLIERGKREWEALVDAVADMILLTDANGRVRRCNRAALVRLLPNALPNAAGGDAHDLCATHGSHPWRAVLHKTPGELLFGGSDGDERLAQLEAGLAPGQEIQFPRLEGWFEASIYPVEAGEGRQKAYLLKDITQRKVMEAAMLSSQKMASLGTLVAGVAHEINSPLQVITGVSESLLNQCRNGGIPAERLERSLTMIHRNGTRVAGLVRALRLYAHTSDQIFRPDQLNEILLDTLLLIEHQLQSWSNIRVHADLAADMPDMECDREKLAQVIINLLTNARDAMPAGGEISITTRYDPAADRFRLIVADDGQGIPPEIQSKIFDPFYTTKPLGEGTGLGLSVVLGVIQTHHGRVTLHSVPKEGTTFIMTFPRTQPPAAPKTPPALVAGRFDHA